MQLQVVSCSYKSFLAVTDTVQPHYLAGESVFALGYTRWIYLDVPSGGSKLASSNCTRMAKVWPVLIDQCGNISFASGLGIAAYL
jgi:hypothetical protein